MTDGEGAEAIIDFVGERGAIEDGVAMLREAGSYYVIGYGENINVPTIDIISREINFIGNLVGSYNDLSELMTLDGAGEEHRQLPQRLSAGRHRRASPFPSNQVASDVGQLLAIRRLTRRRASPSAARSHSLPVGRAESVSAPPKL